MNRRPSPHTTRTRVVLAVTATGALLAGPVAAGSASAATGDLPEQPCTIATPLSPGVVLSCLSGQPANSQTHVVTVDLGQAGKRFDVVPANGRVAQYQPPGGAVADEPVSEMMPRSAVVAVNGGYFDINQNPPGVTTKSYTGQACGGMVSQGRIIKTPPRAFGTTANLVVHRDGRMQIGAAGFTGTITSPTGSTALTSINDVSDAGPQQGCPPDLVKSPSAGDGTTLITPDMGPLFLPAPGSTGDVDFRLKDAVVVDGVKFGPTMIVTSVRSVPLLSSLPALGPFRATLLATGARGQWLASHAARGTVLKVDGSLTVDGAPTSDVQTLISAGANILDAGVPQTPTTPVACGTPQYAPPVPPCGVFPLPGKHAETMIGVSADGRTAYLVVVDDYIRGNTTDQGGLTPEEDGAFLKGLGAHDGLLFDGGGSSTMIARVGGQKTLVNNTYTGDGKNNPEGPNGQRYVANALVINGG